MRTEGHPWARVRVSVSSWLTGLSSTRFASVYPAAIQAAETGKEISGYRDIYWGNDQY